MNTLPAIAQLRTRGGSRLRELKTCHEVIAGVRPLRKVPHHERDQVLGTRAFAEWLR